MRLKKFSLIAAAGLASVAGLSAASATRNGVGVTFGAPITLTNAQELDIVVNSGEAATWSGNITSQLLGNTGNVNVSGGGTLQFGTFGSINYYSQTFIGTTILPQTLTGATRGVLTIDSTNVEVSGYLNQYLQVGDTYAGYSSTVLTGNSRLSFTNTSTNIYDITVNMDGSVDSFINAPRIARLNFIVNLKAGLNNDQAQTQLNVGQTANSILVAQVDANVQGGVGILQGQGDFIKSGAGSFKLLNVATFTGDITVNGGVLSAGGTPSSVVDNALASVHGVNFSMIGSGTGNFDYTMDGVFATRTTPNLGNVSLGPVIGSDYAAVAPYGGFTEYKPLYLQLPPSAPTSSVSVVGGVTSAAAQDSNFASVLKLEGNQTINNLQYLFNTYASTQAYTIGKGMGSAIDALDGSTVILQQTLNGYYAGNFISHDAAGLAVTNGGANFVKMGAATVDTDGTYLTGTLALLGQGSVYRSLDIKEGVILANVQSLGSGSVTVESGALLQFVQNDPGTLNATLHGVGGTLLFSNIAYMMNNGATVLYSGIQTAAISTIATDPVATRVGNGQIGTVDIAVAQSDFYGAVVVQNGIQLIFSTANKDAFANASSLTLKAGDNGEITSLTFNDSDQTFRNFSGDAGTKIDLGQGNVTLVENINVEYQGIISGFGGLIKSGTGAFILSGRDSAGNSNDTYNGATVVKQGALGLNGANQLPNTSGLVIAGGQVAVSGAQTFGGLFGAYGTSLDIGSDNLTIGLSSARLAQVQSSVAVGALAAGNSFYLATTGSNAVVGYTGTAAAFSSGMIIDNSLNANAVAGGTTTTFLYNKAYSNPVVYAALKAVTDAQTAYAAAKTASDDAIANPGDTTKAALAVSTKTAAVSAANAANTAVATANASFVSAVDSAAQNVVVTAGQTAAGAVNTAIAATLQSLANGFQDYATVYAGLGSVASNQAKAYVVASDTAALDLANSQSFAGSISGSGGLIKQGPERLTLTGVNTYTGSTVVQGGELRVNVDSIKSTSSITVVDTAVFAVNVDAGSATFTQTVTGTGANGGNFKKTGAGTLVLADNVINYTGLTTVAAGTLSLTLKAGMTGGVTIANGATLVAVQNDALTYGPAITGTGTFDKEGTATLTLSNFTGFTGNVVVGAGRLQVGALNPSPTGLSIAAGATFTANLAGPTNFTGVTTGAGRFEIIGGNVTFTQSSDAFTGTLAVTNGGVIAATNDIFKNATFAFANSAFNLNGTNQQISAFTGDAVSSVQLANGTLTFDPAAGVVNEFSGVITGNGNIVKNGDGTQRLSTSDGSNPWTGSTTVNAGTLEVSVAALGNSVVTINAPGTLSLYNNIAGGNDSYANALTGNGTLGKSGVGTVSITNASAGFSGNIVVTQGELRLDTTTGTIGTPAKVYPSVSVATGADYAVVLKAGNTVGGVLTMDATDASNRVTDAAAINGVTQHGSFAVEGTGAYTFRFANGQSYTGNTILRQATDAFGVPIPGAAVNLDLVGSTGLNGVLNGLAGDVGSTVITGGAAWTIVQNVEGTFSGNFDALTNITVQGTAKLGFTSSVGNLGDLTVDGGKLVLDAALGNTVTLQNNGTLFFDTTNFNQVYAGSVSGNGNMIKTGAGTLDLLGDLSRFSGLTGAIGVDQGRLVATVASLESASNITGLVTLGQGQLALQVDGGDERKLGVGGLAISITGDGTLVKTGDGKLLLGDAQNPYTLASTGELVVEQGILGGYFTTSGALRVAAGGTLAPGNSPGTVTVNGTFTTNGTLALELAASGPSDKIVVNGAATLGAGTVFNFSQYGAGSLPSGTGYRVIEASGGILVAEGDFTLAPSSLRVILVTPGRNVDASLLNGLLVGRGDPNAVVAYVMPSLSSTAGYAPHDGIGSMLGILDGYTVNQYALPDNAVGAALAFASPGTLNASINNLSPLGYASYYAMTRDSALQQEDRIRERLEQRRYDAAGFANEEWEAFVVASGGTADNTSSSDTPVFDYRTYGGLVGFDKRIEGGSVVGGSLGYDNGTATVHQSGGKFEMNHVRAEAFMSTMVASRWYVEGGVSAGLGDFTSKRDTIVGRNTATTTGYDLGFNVNTGTIITLTEDLHLTPHAGFSYMHQEFDGASETGSVSALKLDSWSQDSLRFTLGTGLGWWLSSGDLKWKLGLDVGYNHEFLDTDSDLEARFTQLGGSKFSVTAAALPQDSISAGPNVGLFFNDTTSVSAGLNYEYGFDGRNYTSINVAFRKRF